MIIFQRGSIILQHIKLLTRGLVTVVFPCAPSPTQTPSDARGISPWSPRYTRIFPP